MTNTNIFNKYISHHMSPEYIQKEMLQKEYDFCWLSDTPRLFRRLNGKIYMAKWNNRTDKDFYIKVRCNNIPDEWLEEL